MGLTSDDIIEIMKLLDGSNFDEMRLEHDDLKLYLKRSSTTGDFSISDSEPVSTISSNIDSVDNKVAPPEKQASVDETSVPDQVEGLENIISPMQGTFYSSPKPGESPFVDIGSHVEATTVICIVEVMKLMNSVTVGMTGEIVEICVEDGDIIDKDQVLFRIKSI